MVTLHIQKQTISCNSANVNIKVFHTSVLLQYHKLFAQSCFTGLESVKLCSGAVNFLLKETKFFKAHFGGRRGELE